MHLLAFPLPEELAAALQGVITRIRRADHRGAHAPELVRTVNRLTEVGLDHFFLRPLREVGITGFNLRTAELGIASARRGIAAFVRRVLSSMSDAQLLRLVQLLDEMRVERPRQASPPS